MPGRQRSQAQQKAKHAGPFRENRPQSLLYMIVGPQLYSGASGQLLRLPGKCGVGHDNRHIAIVEGCPGMGFLHRFVSHRMGVVFALNPVFFSSAPGDDIQSLIAALLSYRNMTITIPAKPSGTDLFIFKSVQNEASFPDFDTTRKPMPLCRLRLPGTPYPLQLPYEKRCSCHETRSIPMVSG